MTKIDISSEITAKCNKINLEQLTLLNEILIFNININILKILTLVLILNLDFWEYWYWSWYCVWKKYWSWYWYWSWLFFRDNIDIDLDIENEILENIDIDIEPQSGIVPPLIWVYISEGKTCIKNPKTCGPSKWPPLTNGMSCSCERSVSIEKLRHKRRTSLSFSCFI